MQRTCVGRRARDAEDPTDGTFRDKARELFVINKYLYGARDVPGERL